MLAPALNFLPMEENTPDRKEVIRNLVREEPDASLFEPPQGAHVASYPSERDFIIAMSRRNQGASLKARAQDEKQLPLPGVKT